MPTLSLNRSGATQVVPSTLPLTSTQAKRLVGVLAVASPSGWPVVYAGQRITRIEEKRHPYDDWHEVKLAGNVSTSSTNRYRAVV
jgi:hypothetical protein